MFRNCYLSALALVLVHFGTPARCRADVVIARDFTVGDQTPVRVDVALAPGRLWLVRVHQHGVNSALEIDSPEQASATRYDSRLTLSIDTNGYDMALIEPPRAGTYGIRISTAERGMPEGRVELQVRSLDKATAPSTYLAALAAESEANRLLGTSEPEQRDAARLAFARAAHSYEEAGRGLEAANAWFSAAELARQSGDISDALVAYSTARDHYERSQQAETVAYVDWAEGHLLRQSGKLDEALVLLERAATGLRGAEFAIEPARARDHYCLALHTLGRLEEARRCYDSVLKEFQRLGAPAAEAIALSNIGGVLLQQQELESARRQFAQALALQRELGLADEMIATRNNLALTFRRAGRYQSALENYLENVRYCRSQKFPGPLARALNNTGYTYFVLGELTTARDYLLEAAQLRRTIGDMAGLAMSLKNLGVVEYQLGSEETAEYHLLDAIQIADRFDFRDRLAAARIALGRLQLERGRFDLALSEYRLAMKILHRSEEKRQLDDALHGAGVASLRLGDTDAASDYLQRALSTPERRYDPAARAETLYALAELDIDRQELNSADSHLDEAIGLLESVRSEMTNPDLRRSFIATVRGTYELKTDLVMTRHSRDPGSRLDLEALAINEKARARTLTEFLSARALMPKPRVDAQLAERERALRREFVALIDAVVGGPDSDGDIRLRRISEDLSRLKDEIRQTSPEYAALYYPQALSVASMQKALGPGVTLLQFALGSRRSFLWVVDQAEVRSFVLPSRERIETLAGQLFQETRVNNPQGRRRQEDLIEELSGILFGQLKPLPENQRLLIVPDGALHYVPFEMFRFPGETGAPLLVQQHEIIYAPSVTAVAVQRRLPRLPAQHTLAIVADPVYSADDRRAGAGAQFADYRLDSPPIPIAARADALRSDRLQRIPASYQEARQIASMVPQRELLLATGFDADRGTILGGALSGYRFVHFATHGIVNMDVPYASGLALSRYSRSGRAVPGFLSMADLYSMNLSADLVVLSACDTALGKQINGEGLIGLNRGFMAAGAKQILASSWEISDTATAEFMQRFYSELIEHKHSSSAALRETQLSFLHKRNRTLPYYWAAFRLSGDWD